MSEGNQEIQIKNLKKLLDGWRMAVLPIKSIFLWEQQWHPCAIVATVSVLYFIIWLMDLNSLATFAIIGLFFNFLDFIVPIICNSICNPNSWTGQHEKVFDEVCRSIVSSYNKTLHQLCQFYSLRENSPFMYYIISISMLCTLAWMAASINNVFLLYIFSVVILLWPGIQHRGIFNTLLGMMHMAPKTIKLQ
ncbi:ADP-ribosylation factor-like protein 6-interacting protein 1 [Pieris napi]|uniref:RETREG1-3/ARL6IP-like N-terminal reticulon-homology domain-containing protein n=1 Tax=Pieris macdunnoughi TaxID=345717 RepID=A0A821X9Y3_9NEOP|nr:ADP-ribosylation factor-like protein 6-interacting protein 1 [Pieris napi]CAF4938562.1 unnamed protein product [Pieris macdunnoughi]